VCHSTPASSKSLSFDQTRRFKPGAGPSTSSESRLPTRRSAVARPFTAMPRNPAAPRLRNPPSLRRRARRCSTESFEAIIIINPAGATAEDMVYTVRTRERTKAKSKTRTRPLFLLEISLDSDATLAWPSHLLWSRESEDHLGRR
jgi:hypothetical protein